MADQSSSSSNQRRLNPNAAEFVPRMEFSNSRYRGGGRGRENRNQRQGRENREFSGHQGHQHGRNDGRRRETREDRPGPNADNLRMSISDRLRNETYECMICCDRIRWTNAVWSCQLCFSVFHLRCAKRWANSCSGSQQDGQPPTASSGEWRCPGCQSVNRSVPNVYKCFCGKMTNPSHETWSQRGHTSVPHTCGELCQKRRGVNGGNDCPHPCNDLCHPGPCDSCPLTVDRKCLCGRESRRVRCGSEDFQCGQICGKLLNCSIHQCERVCHAGECSPCEEKIVQDCFCGQSPREVPCGDSLATNGQKYTCGTACEKLHDCGIHQCDKKCHDGDCGKCPFDPQFVTKCCCGKFNVEELSIDRKSCTDPLPMCENICGKKLKCGEEGNGHICQSKCHPGPCPPCTLSTSVRCRCGATNKSLPCTELEKYDADHPLLCERRCSKKRTCKQHKCGELCCIDTDHICTQNCGRKLNCGIHTCEALCHGGKCRPCLHASFEELTCTCGISVIEPPVRCGTKPPSCDMPCTRQHNCQHPVTHNCHSDDQCPPCTYLTAKMCYGKHDMRKNIPCYLDGISCGMPCGAPLACGQHTCIRACHSGACQANGDQCTQPCVRPRCNCGHPCAVKCHGESACPEEKLCQFVVKVTCKCGHESENMACFEIDRLATQRFMSKATKADVKHEVDLDELTRQESMERYKCLTCSDECARVERNRRFADALDVKTDDFVGDSGPPAYTDFLKDQFKLLPDFILGLEKTLGELVSSADKSKQPSRSHVFPPMNRNQRHIIHEYGHYYGVDTMAYDQEPQRNVVATASRGKSKVPSILLSTVVQKENGKPTTRVVPPNVNHTLASTPATMKTLQSASGTVVRR